jgi:hypothetical protein
MRRLAVPAVRHELLVQLDLPVVTGERAVGAERADVRLDPLAVRHPHDQLGVGAAGQRGVHRRREGAAEARVDVGDAEPDLAVAEDLHGAGAAHAERLDDRAAELDQLGVGDRRALDRLAAARLEHRARDRVEAAAVEVGERVDRELRAVHRALDHRRLLHVAHEEGCFLGVVREVDRARAGTLARLHHHRVGRRRVAGQHGGRRRKTELLQQQVRLVLVVRRARDRGVGRERRQDPVDARLGQHLDVEVGERDDRADVVLGAQLGERRHVVGIVDARRGEAVVRGVLRGCERIRVGGDRRRVLGEGGDDVVALADAGEEDRFAHVRHPPVSPL